MTRLLISIHSLPYNSFKIICFMKLTSNKNWLITETMFIFYQTNKIISVMKNCLSRLKFCLIYICLFERVLNDWPKHIFHWAVRVVSQLLYEGGLFFAIYSGVIQVQSWFIIHAKRCMRKLTHKKRTAWSLQLMKYTIEKHMVSRKKTHA